MINRQKNKQIKFCVANIFFLDLLTLRGQKKRREMGLEVNSKYWAIFKLIFGFV